MSEAGDKRLDPKERFIWHGEESSIIYLDESNDRT